jgi:hypothetical protein
LQGGAEGGQFGTLLADVLRAAGSDADGGRSEAVERLVQLQKTVRLRVFQLQDLPPLTLLLGFIFTRGNLLIIGLHAAAALQRSFQSLLH